MVGAPGENAALRRVGRGGAAPILSFYDASAIASLKPGVATKTVTVANGRSVVKVIPHHFRRPLDEDDRRGHTHDAHPTRSRRRSDG
jgi:hypothetical protein